MDEYLFLLVDDTPQHLVFVLLKGLPVDELLELLVELVLDELVDGRIRDEVARVAEGEVEDGGRGIDVLVVVPEIDVDGCPAPEGESPAVENAPSYHG